MPQSPSTTQDPPGTNAMIESILADAEAIGLVQSCREHFGELVGQFDNDPVADYGPAAADQARRFIDLVLALPEDESEDS